MTHLSNQLQREIVSLVGTAFPTIVTLTAGDSTVLTVELESVESVSSLVNCVAVESDRLKNVTTEALQECAEKISSQITCLLEDLGLVEVDSTTGQVLVRSRVPTQAPDATEYYEVLFRAEDGRISLERFAWSMDRSGRRRIPMQLTHEVLIRIVRDLEAAVLHSSATAAT